MPKKLMASDCEVQGEKAVLSGDAACTLTESLIQKPAETFAELASNFGIIRPSELSVSPDGKLTISNPDAVRKISEAITTKGGDAGFFDTNCSCKV